MGPERYSDSRTAPDTVIESWANTDALEEEAIMKFGEDAAIAKKMIIAAKVYMIAKEQGRPAAMLWKLQNSG